jgi:hypothetical protein
MSEQINDLEIKTYPNAELKVVTFFNKKDQPYKMLEIYIPNPDTGELLKVHSVYMNDTLKTIFELLTK